VSRQRSFSVEYVGCQLLSLDQSSGLQTRRTLARSCSLNQITPFWDRCLEALWKQEGEQFRAIEGLCPTGAFQLADARAALRATLVANAYLRARK